MMQAARNSHDKNKEDLNNFIKSLPLRDLHTSFDLIAAHRMAGTAVAPLTELEKIKQGHEAYKSFDIDAAQLCGINFRSGLDEHLERERPPVEAVILSSQAHFDADVVVVRCMDNRCSSPNIELNMQPHQVCEIVSAGHVIEEKELESLAVGILLKGAKVILLEAHGGVCGAIKLAMTERDAGIMEHSMTEKIAKGLGGYKGVDTPEIFAGTLENLSQQMGKILNPKLELKLLRDGTGKGSFYELIRDGHCIVIGVYVDFEVLKAKGTNENALIKRLSFFDSPEALSHFVDAKISAYLSRDRHA